MQEVTRSHLAIKTLPVTNECVIIIAVTNDYKLTNQNGPVSEHESMHIIRKALQRGIEWTI